MSSAGEDTSKWPLYQPGFIGTVRQLTCCGRCGEPLNGGYHTKRRIFFPFKFNMHWMCDPCYEQLPE